MPLVAPYRSPIHMVVPELLLKIFVQCILLDDFPICGATAVPMIISQVCSDWRSLALNFSFLWSSFKITISTFHACPSPALVQLWLQRSASKPLAFCLELDQFPPVRDMAQVMRAKSLLRMLSTRSHLWREVNLLLPGSHDLLQPLTNLMMPQLQTLGLTLRNCHEKDFSAIDSLLHSAPALSFFSWSNRSTWGRWDGALEGSFVPNHNWQRLTHLIYNSSISLSTSYSILQYATSLVVCDLHHFGTADEPSVPSFEPIFLPHLTTLIIYQERDDGTLGLFIDFVTTPALRKFSLTCGRVEDCSWPQKLISLLSRSHSELEALCLECTSITQEDLIQCLWTTHRSLTKLELHDRYGNICVGDKLLRLLSRNEHNEIVFCPHLVALILHGVTRSSDAVLTVMLQSQTEYFTCIDLDLSGENSTNAVDKCYLADAVVKAEKKHTGLL